MTAKEPLLEEWRDVVDRSDDEKSWEQLYTELHEMYGELSVEYDKSKNEIRELVEVLEFCAENHFVGSYKMVQIGSGAVGNTTAEREVKRLCHEQYDLCKKLIAKHRQKEGE